MQPRRRVGRPALTDRRALVVAAREIGFAGLTVGAVTSAVGVKYSTFYRHFPTLDDLVSALVDDVCSDIPIPSPAVAVSWQDSVRSTCATLCELNQRYPGLASAVVELPELPQRVLRIYQGLTEVLLTAGFDAERAALGAVYALETVSVTALTTPGAGHTMAARQRSVESGPGAGIDPGVRAATAALATGPTDAWTARKIELLIHGLEADHPGSAAWHRN